MSGQNKAEALGGESAFPITPPVDPNCGGPAGGYYFPETGLTKREHAAIQIAAGLARFKLPGSTLPEAVAREAVEITDALLKELAK